MRLATLVRALTALATSAVLAGCLYPRPEPEPPGPPPPPPPPPPKLDPRIERVDLHVKVQSMESETTRASCVRDIEGALARHGFVVSPSGERVDAVLSLFVEPVAETYLDNSIVQLPKYDAPRPQVPRPPLTAHLGARVGLRGQELRVTNTGIAPCGGAGDRLADALLASFRASLRASTKGR
jgi:hypothetical protein